MSANSILLREEPTAPDSLTIPRRMDALPWSRWHLRFVLALGITWLLDGLEGSLGESLQRDDMSEDGSRLAEAS